MKDIMTAGTNWWRNAIIYHIYPRSFMDSNNDGIGDLIGIIQKLSYLADLGIDAIWLSPIYPSPDVDFGYDVSDYYDIDPKYGTLSDFDKLIAESKKRGIRIILDLVLNHSSDQHPWFLDSRSSKNSTYRDWYIWHDPIGHKGRPNNWQSRFVGPAWTMDQTTGQFYFHTFFPQQPDLNWRNAEVRNEMMNIFKYWMEKGVDGFRLDVFNAYFKHANFQNNPIKLGLRSFDWQQHVFDCNQPEMFPLLNGLRSLLDSYPEKYAVGETYLDSTGQAERYCGDKLLHAAFNFNLANAPWNPNKMLSAINQWEQSLSEDSWPTQVLNNHDLIRSATRYTRDETDQRLKLAAIMLLTLRGTPFLYYGEEIGMRDIAIKRKDIKDPVGKKYWPFYKGRDGCRSLMQWNNLKYAGFSEHTPWLPVHANYEKRNVENQATDKDSLLNFYRALTGLRREQSALRHGDFLPLQSSPNNMLAFLRKTEQDTILIAINFSKRPLKLELEQHFSIYNWDILLSNYQKSTADIASNKINLQAEEGLILKAK